MPKNPTPEERIKWHKEHDKHCACSPRLSCVEAGRPIPEKITEEIKKRSQCGCRCCGK
jgi:hypothetical protein